MARFEWYVYQHAVPPKGPFSSEQLLQKHQEGEFDAGAQVCPAEGGDFRPLADALTVAQTRCTERPRPWFILREGQPPLGPLDDKLLQRGVDAGKVPPDAMMSRANGLAWYSQARAMNEPEVVINDIESRQEKTAIRPAQVQPPPAPAPVVNDEVARERRTVLTFFLVPVLLVLFALVIRKPSSPPETNVRSGIPASKASVSEAPMATVTSSPSSSGSGSTAASAAPAASSSSGQSFSTTPRSTDSGR